MSFNKIILVGNLGRDPELRYTPQGTAVCSFSLATNERRKSASGEQQDMTTWFRVTLWGKQAEAASKYLTKGRPVYIEGRLRTEEWTDRDGKTRNSLEVHATDMQFIGTRGEDGGGGDSSYESEAPPSRGAAGGGSTGGGSGFAGSGASRQQPSRTAFDEEGDFGGGAAAGATDEDIPF